MRTCPGLNLDAGILLAKNILSLSSLSYQLLPTAVAQKPNFSAHLKGETLVYITTILKLRRHSSHTSSVKTLIFDSSAGVRLSKSIKK